MATIIKGVVKLNKKEFNIGLQLGFLKRIIKSHNESMLETIADDFSQDSTFELDLDIDQNLNVFDGDLVVGISY